VIDKLIEAGAKELGLAQAVKRDSFREFAQVARGILPGTNMIEHQFPLRAGLMVRLVLPADLTKKGIKRLVRFMESLIW
jgi:hypothetical protein